VYLRRSSAFGRRSSANLAAPPFLLDELDNTGMEFPLRFEASARGSSPASLAPLDAKKPKTDDREPRTVKNILTLL